MSATSEVLICNLALARVGVSQGITSLESSSTEAQQCNLHYAQTRDLLLRDFAWPFATKFRALDLIATASTQDWADEWDFAYRYPVDALRILGFLGLSGPRDSDPITRPLELGDDSQGQVIYCNEEDARVAYTSKVTNPARFPADFSDALAWRMASLLAMPLSARSDLRQQADQEFERAIAQAKVSALNERKQHDQPDAEHIRARE